MAKRLRVEENQQWALGRGVSIGFALIIFLSDSPSLPTIARIAQV
jgi:hypothetical protein